MWELVFAVLIIGAFGQNNSVPLCIYDVASLQMVLKERSNHANLTQALYPTSDDATVYLDVFILRENPLELVDRWVWTLSCLYTAIDTDIFPKISLGTIYPSRKSSELYLTLPPFCPGTNDTDQILEDALFTIQSIAIDPINPKVTDNTADCVCRCFSKDHVLNYDRPELKTVQQMLLISLIIAILSGITAGWIAFHKLQMLAKDSKTDERFLRPLAVLLWDTNLWIGILVGLLGYTFVLYFNIALVVEEDFIRVATALIITIASLTFALWLVCFVVLALQARVVSWNMFKYDDLRSPRLIHLIVTALGAAIFSFVFAFELSWAILGVFLDSTWAVPLFGTYAMFFAHVFIWGQQIYYSSVTFKKRAIQLLAEQVFKKQLESHFGQKITGLLKFLLNQQERLKILGVNFDENKIKIALANRKAGNLTEIGKVLEEIAMDPEKVTSFDMGKYLDSFEEASKSKENLFNLKFLTKYWDEVRTIVQEVQKLLNLSVWELSSLAAVTAAILLLLVIFVGWSFHQITRDSIGLALLQAVVISLLAVLSKALVWFRDQEKQFETKENGNAKIKQMGANILENKPQPSDKHIALDMVSLAAAQDAEEKRKSEEIRKSGDRDTLEEDEEKVKKIVAMGFDTERAKRALEACNNNVERTIAFLVHDKEKAETEHLQNQAAPKLSSKKNSKKQIQSESSGSDYLPLEHHTE